MPTVSLVSRLFTVGKNIIGAPKMRNNYRAIKLFIIQILRQQYWTLPSLHYFSVSLLKAIAIDFPLLFARETEYNYSNCNNFRKNNNTQQKSIKKKGRSDNFYYSKFEEQQQNKEK